MKQIRKIDSDTLLNIRLFRDVTGIDCSDCFTANSTVMFITKPGLAGKAIGKMGKNIKQLRNTLKKNVKIFEEADDPCDLIRNYVFPTKPKRCDIVENVVEIEFNTSRERRFLLDNQQRGLKELKAILERYYPAIKDIKIL